MLKLKKIAITGAVAAGKSSLLEMFRNCSAFCLDCDQIVHHLIKKKGILKQKSLALFGSSILVGDEIDRQKLASKAFVDPAKLRDWENIVHPLVLEEIVSVYRTLNPIFPLFVVEVPLLFESPLQALRDFFDYCIVVIGVHDKKKVEKRFNKSHFSQRKNRLISDEEKAKRADFVVHNTGSKQELQRKAEQLYIQLTKS
ncbi:MAG: dephospho-CoA kinase [Chlamydiota bacterium]